ncbi:uncharacterized protein K489DRAFT_154427 [Dissoconium aciculare CBS 342.82]|uniref:Uncharacterized protein n=1 Tax=Dissoconium aciculare CBS 342.82 TaxID=1314786 RepID=A0A6J3MBA1_9PEZI|nr:uncharacterized protein K489DRAFT_154427 [Dissoconium aciculare CBS 342.82]KAF1825301.1 hypothetical protein K489DRAFT_154427 [Dissoconium aciculare CBS 342.82]
MYCRKGMAVGKTSKESPFEDRHRVRRVRYRMIVTRFEHKGGLQIHSDTNTTPHTFTFLQYPQSFAYSTKWLNERRIEAHAAYNVRNAISFEQIVAMSAVYERYRRITFASSTSYVLCVHSELNSVEWMANHGATKPQWGLLFPSSLPVPHLRSSDSTGEFYRFVPQIAHDRECPDMQCIL